MRTENSTDTEETQPAQSQVAEYAASVLERLEADFETLSPQLQRAARFIIDQPREVGLHSMRTLAGMAEVHPNTLVRLAQSLGFDGYDAMRERFRVFMVGDGLGSFKDRADWLQTLARTGGSLEIIAEMAEATGKNLEAMWRGQDAPTLDAIAGSILAADRVFVLGMGSAYSLAHSFWYVARMAFDHIVPIPRHGSHPLDDLSRVSARDVVMALTFQPYRSETIDAVRHAKAIGATIVGVTDSRSSPLARLSDHVLVSPTHTPQFFESHAAVLAMLEGLVAVLVAQAGEDASSRIEDFHRRRVDIGLYEEHPALLKLERVAVTCSRDD